MGAQAELIRLAHTGHRGRAAPADSLAVVICVGHHDALGLALALLAGVGEEILFRGFIQGGLGIFLAFLNVPSALQSQKQ